MKSEERIEELCTALRKRQIFAACIQESWRSGNELIVTTGLPKEMNKSNRGSQGVGIILSPAARRA